jgi:hypothetical protein
MGDDKGWRNFLPWAKAVVKVIDVTSGQTKVL